MFAVLNCCPTSLGISQLLPRSCIFCKIVLVRVIVVSSFSQVCLLALWLSDRSLFKARSCWGGEGGGSVAIGWVNLVVIMGYSDAGM